MQRDYDINLETFNEIHNFADFVSDNLNVSYDPQFSDLWTLWETDNSDDRFFIELAFDASPSPTFLLEKIGWSGEIFYPTNDQVQRREDGRTCSINYLTSESFINPAKEISTMLASRSTPSRIAFLSVPSGESAQNTLRDFDFDRYTVRLIRVRYENTSERNQNHNVLSAHGYERKWPEYFDTVDWYVSQHSDLETQGRDGMISQAIKDCSRNPFQLGPRHFELSQLYSKLGRAQNESEQLQLAVANNPNNARYNLFLGTSLRKMKRSEEAVTHLNVAIEINPRLGDAYFELSAALFDLGRGPEALTCISNALTHFPMNPKYERHKAWLSKQIA